MKKFTPAQISRIKRLAKEGYGLCAVADMMGVHADHIRKLRANKTVKFRCGYEISREKSKIFREKVHAYRLKHGTAKAAEKFGLTHKTASQYSAQAVRDNKKLQPFDDRRKDKWSAEDLVYLLRKSGIDSREDIKTHLKRGDKVTLIKEKLQDLGVCSKNVNGISTEQFLEIFGVAPPVRIEGSARFKIVPYQYVVKYMNKSKVDINPTLKIYFETMALFQKWIYGDEDIMELVAKPAYKLRMKGSGKRLNRRFKHKS